MLRQSWTFEVDDGFCLKTQHVPCYIHSPFFLYLFPFWKRVIDTEYGLCPAIVSIFGSGRGGNQRGLMGRWERWDSEIFFLVVVWVWDFIPWVDIYYVLIDHGKVVRRLVVLFDSFAGRMMYVVSFRGGSTYWGREVDVCTVIIFGGVKAPGVCWRWGWAKRDGG